MPKINLLSEDLINKIAAGEVIERPASVVKELIENSLDAGATKINIDIEDSGKRLIRVSDNGEGMDQEDAEHSILRHATSKIKDDPDLFSIHTLGFRGEALASIAAVSHLTLITKPKDKLEGFQIEVEGGNIIHSGMIGAESGTTIEVRDLFFNTPARKKFLKGDAVEMHHIIETIIRYALLHAHVAIKLVHDGHVLVHSPAVERGRDNIASIYGTTLAKELLEVGYQDEKVKIQGYIAPPHHARNDKNQQVLFVNGRWVKNNDIMNAIYNAYHSTLFLEKHPVVILMLELDPQSIDVNIHPAKTEVKIEQGDLVYQAVYNAVKETLKKNNLIPILGVEEEQLTFGTPPPPVKQKEEARYTFEPTTQAIFHVKEAGPVLSEPIEQNDPALEMPTVANGKIEKERVEMPRMMEATRFPPFKILGQIHKTFFVAETLGGLFYIDQHAAHERVLYERFMAQYMKKEVQVQRLLQGEIIEFSALEKMMTLRNKELLEKYGFQVEPFGDSAFVIKTIPLLFGRLQPKEIIFDVLHMLEEGKYKIEENKEEIVTRMACRSAVMAGETLTIQEMEKIMGDLARTELPFTCPHGRPTIIKVTAEELEKKFKRRG